MKLKALLFSALLLFSCTSLRVLAQVKPAIQQIIETRLPNALPYFVQGDAASRFRTQQQGNDVRDLDAGVLRARYRINGNKSTVDTGLATSPDQASRAYLASVREEFGLSASADDLQLLSVISGPYGTHVTYQQTLAGIPVYDRFVKVNVNASGSPGMVLSGYAPHLATVTNFDTQPRYTSIAAGNEIQVLLDQETLSMDEPQLVIYPTETPKLAWKMVVWPESPAVELEVLVDALDGSIIKIQNTSTHLSNKGLSAAPAPSQGFSSSSTANSNSANSNSANKSPTSVSNAQGTGYVFDPDPLTTANQFYAPPYVDNDDADNDALSAQRFLVDLIDISLDNDGLYRLRGPHVQIVSETSGGSDNYTPPAETSLDGFRYTRSNDFFEAVNVYYHIDKSQRYLQSLNVGWDIQNVPIRVNPHGLGLEDNSRYFTSQNYIAFGQGGIDDAEDAHVIWHEYGHALLQGGAPGLLNSTEGQALHEGWADYWATSYGRSLADNNTVPRQDWRDLFKWDSGDGTIWQGREMFFTGKYPDDTSCDNGGSLCNIYEDGIMWAATLMDIYDGLGRSVTDRLALASHAYLMHPVSFRDAAEAIIQADADLNNHENVDFLIQTFNDKGLIDLSSFGPIALHDALRSTEQLGGTVPVNVNATGISAPIASVSLFYTIGDGPQETLELTTSSGEQYEGQLPLPALPSDITYFILVEDDFGLQARLPGTDPQMYAFSNGPDTEPPAIQHIQHPSVTLVDWPAEVVATVTDNLDVDVVEVAYLVHDSQGIQTASDTFTLTRDANEYRGVFPILLENLEAGSSISYQLIARDVSIAGNQSYLPASGYFFFNIIIEDGVFRQYDFEDETLGIIASGAWQRGTPGFGLKIAHSAANTWATYPSAAYPATAERASLELPPMNLMGIPEAYLVFWHWFDTEHDGAASPDSGPGTLLWDGGNIKTSTDGGSSWDVLQPVKGYNGRIASGRENPLSGEPAFGGYSFGWRQVVAVLPVGSEVRIRFDFGTDTGNSESSLAYAGWYIDDITVRTEPPVDTNLPSVISLPALLVVRDQGQLPPEPYIELYDSTGVESVFVDYAVAGGSSIPDGSFRLPMNVARKDVFTGGFPFATPASFSVGNILTYRYRISDFAGNTTIYPPQNDAPLTVEYRLRDHIDLLENVTASGLWKQAVDSWEILRQSEPQEISSLVFGPINLPTNVDNLQLMLFFEHEFADNHGGNIKISTDKAHTWEVLLPANGYYGFMADVDAVPTSMRGQSAFTGNSTGLQHAGFDLLDHKGKQIWLRADFGAKTQLAEREGWTISEASLAYSTLEAVNGTFDIPRAFTLHANYPDPFSASTTISYTLPEATSVKLDVYDVLGRRVALLVNEEQPEGTHSLALDGSSLSAGLYLLRLETNQGTKIERMVVVE